MPGENLFCKGLKANSKEYVENYEKIFQQGDGKEFMNKIRPETNDPIKKRLQELYDETGDLKETIRLMEEELERGVNFFFDGDYTPPKGSEVDFIFPAEKNEEGDDGDIL